MITNLNLMSVGTEIAEAIKDNATVISFCNEEFGTQPHYFVGELLKKQIPTAEETPYVVVCDLTKVEGVNVEYCEYHCSIIIGVGSDTKSDVVETSDGINTVDIYDVCNAFMQVIINALHERKFTQRPIAKLITRGTYPVESDGTHWASILECNWRVYQTLGLDEQEF